MVQLWLVPVDQASFQQTMEDPPISPIDSRSRYGSGAFERTGNKAPGNEIAAISTGWSRETRCWSTGTRRVNTPPWGCGALLAHNVHP